MAQAIVYTEIGTPDVLHLAEIPDPTPGPGELLVEIKAAGVNPIDAKLRGGIRPTPPITEPRRVGFDGAGIVAALGEGVTGFSIGDRVAIGWGNGTYSTLATVAATNAAVLPESVSFEEAAGIGIPAGTAYQGLKSLGVTADDTVLIHGGSGAVGQTAVQFAVAWGAKVIATGSPARHEQLRALGATPVAYGEGLEARVREAAPEGITVAFDCVGTDEALDTSLALVSDKHRIATIVRGPDAAEYGIRAFSGGSPTPLTAEEEALRIEALAATVALIAEGKFVIDVGQSFPLSEAVAAHELIETGKAGGKLILLP